MDDLRLVRTAFHRADVWTCEKQRSTVTRLDVSVELIKGRIEESTAI